MSVPYRIIFFTEAGADLVRLRAFIEEHNPNAANRAVSKIRESLKMLAEYPLLGLCVENIDVPNLRELFVQFGKSGYLIRYRIVQNEIQIIRYGMGEKSARAYTKPLLSPVTSPPPLCVPLPPNLVGALIRQKNQFFRACR